MNHKDYDIVQPIKGVPVVRIGKRFLPLEPPVAHGKLAGGGGYWFEYEGSKRARLSINTQDMTETLEEVSGS